MDRNTENQTNEINDLKKALADITLSVELSKKDIQGIEKFHTRAEILLDEFRSSLSRINQIINSQELITGNLENEFNTRITELRGRVVDLEKRLDALKQSIAHLGEETSKIQNTLPTEIKKEVNVVDTRVRDLENFKWKWVGVLLGASVILSLAFSFGMPKAVGFIQALG